MPFDFSGVKKLITSVLFCLASAHHKNTNTPEFVNSEKSQAVKQTKNNLYFGWTQWRQRIKKSTHQIQGQEFD